MPDRRGVILWDVGGTLVDFAGSLPESVRRRLAGCGINHSGISDEHIEQTYADFIGAEQRWRTIEHERAAETSWLKALLRGEISEGDSINQIAERMPRYFDLFRVVDGVMELLGELWERRIAMGVVSNWPPSLPEILEHHQLGSFFDVVVYSAQDGIHKPDERIFRRALNGLGANPDDAVMIGDNFELDIVPSRGMGMRAIHFDPRRKSDLREADDAAGLRRLLSAELKESG
jgi:HAD superfamily hydrolase (TIGR01549 family)